MSSIGCFRGGEKKNINIQIPLPVFLDFPTFYKEQLGKTLRVLLRVLVGLSSRLLGFGILLSFFIPCTSSMQLFFIYKVGFFIYTFNS